MTYPVVIGHEVSATVVEAGGGVADFAPGDKATVEPQIFCGECHPCSIGRFNVCEKLAVLGVHRDGFCQEYVAVDARYLHKCPPGMKETDMAFVEPAAVGVGSVKRAPDYRGANVVVVGAGAIGNLTAQAAKALGAAKVMITDISEQKLELARRFGIEPAVNTEGKNLADVISDHFGRRKADIIIDCAATKGSILSILAAARRSSSVIITGNFKEPVEIELPVLQRQEIALIGHMMYVREDYADAIRFLSEGAMRVDGLISKVFPFREAREAFAHIDAHPAETMKVLLEF
jgi:L-iditol 2-dehydrogenase